MRTSSGRGELIAKFQGRLWVAEMDHSPLDVVAWHGNYAPYKYDLRRFNAVGSISYDHPDPSIFLVLHSPSDTPGTGNVDFVVFPPRWLAMQDTFRPPWFHRNVASEYLGLITGLYDAKSERLRAGRRLAAQLHERTRSRRGDIREGHRRRHLSAGAHQRHDGIHVREPHGDQTDPPGPRGPAAAARGLPRVLVGFAQTL